MASARKTKIMGRNDRGKLKITVQTCNQLKYRVGCPAVQVAGRLICQQNLRLSDQRPRQCSTLLFTARKFACAMMTPLRQANFLQPLQGFLFGVGLRVAPHQQRHGNVLKRGKLRQQIVELPNEANFAVTKISSGIFRKRAQAKLRAVYFTCRRLINRAQNVQ